MTAPPARAPGAPSAAVPALVGYAFIVIVAPPFYVLFLLSWRYLQPGGTDFFITPWLLGSIAWIALIVGLTLYPAVRGQLWAVRLMRVLSVLGLLALLAALAGDAAGHVAGQQARTIAFYLFWCPLAPLLIAGGFLLDGLLHQPWFNPEATPAEIGPSRGTLAEADRWAGVDEAGRLPPAIAAAALAAPPVPRWLCYLAPPLAALGCKQWLQAALLAVLCLAALAMLAFMPVRAVFIYLLMGTFADRLRALHDHRRHLAEAQRATPPPAGRRIRPRA